jgi:hypothetical protein
VDGFHPPFFPGLKGWYNLAQGNALGINRQKQKNAL